jgi:hypothetical protein
MSAKYKLFAGAVFLLALAGLATTVIRTARPAVTLNLVSRSTTNGVVLCTFGLTNRGSTITYRGYSKDSPAYTFLRDAPLGRVTNNVFWCGTGMNEQTLSHNEGVEFNLHFPATNGPTAAMVNYSQPRWFDRVIARAPNFIRAKLPQRDYRSVELRLSS